VSDHVVAAIAALGLVLITATIGAIRRGQPNPVLFHNVAWIGSLGLLALGWVTYVHVGVEAWFIILAGVLAFNVGALGPSIIELPKVPVVPVRRDMPGGRTLLPLLFFVGFAWYMKSLSSTFGLSTVIAHPSLVRTHQGDSDFITSFSLPGRLLYSLGPLVFVTHACPWLTDLHITRLRRGSVLIATTVAMALSLGRTYLFIAFLWTIACYFVARPEVVVKLKKRLTARRTKLRRRMVMLLGAVVALVTFQLLATVLGKTASNVALVQQYASGPLRNSSFTSAYVYVTGGIPAFASEVSGSPPVEGQADPLGKLGWSTFYPAVKLVPEWKVAPLVRPFDAIPFPFNAYTWFDPLYRDFGIPGVIAGPFIFGALVASLIARRKRTAEGALFVGLMLSLTLFAPFLSKFNDPAVWDVGLALLVLRIWPRSKAKRTGPPLRTWAQFRKPPPQLVSSTRELSDSQPKFL